MIFSVVIPVYGCRTSLIELCLRLKTTLTQISNNYEIILVNDASPDGAWETILELSQKDNRIKGINFSRNFGQHYAISAGLRYAKGEWIIVMDCDLQDKPEEIIKLYNKAIEGYDIVFGRRKNRQDNFLKKNTSKIFFKLYNYLTGSTNDRSIGNFAIYSSKLIDAYKQIKERNQALILFVDVLGFKKEYIDIEHSERLEGKSSYNFKKLIDLAINNITSQSNKPLILSIKIGFYLSFVSFLYGIFLIIKKIFFNLQLGWTSIMVSVIFMGGLILANIGVVGLYIGKIFDEVKNRPLYFIQDKIGID